MQILRAFKTGYCQPPPPGCPRNVYKLMVDCWWVQQWLASQNLLLKLASVTYKYKCIIYKWVQSYNYAVLERKCHTANSMNICYCCSAYSQTYLLYSNSVDFVLCAKCLCSHNTTPHLPLPSMHIPRALSSHTHTLCLHCTCWDKSTTNLSPHPTLNLQEPRTQQTSGIWRHHSGPGQRPCSTAELESTGQNNLFQICYLGSTPGGRETSLPRPTEQVLVVEILPCDVLF